MTPARVAASMALGCDTRGRALGCRMCEAAVSPRSLLSRGSSWAASLVVVPMAPSDMPGVHRIYDFEAFCLPWSAFCFGLCYLCCRSCCR